MALFWRRWLFLILGGALFTPYAVLAMVAVPYAVLAVVDVAVPEMSLLAVAVIGIAIGVTSFLPAVRALEAALVPVLVTGPASSLTVVSARTWSDRLRGSAWYLLHTVVGAAVAALSVLVPPVAFALVVGAARGEATIAVGNSSVGIAPAWGWVIAVVLLLALGPAVWLAGAGLASAAPRLLGPSPSARMADLERRTRQLVERDRLARELHDSIGHALTLITLQAGAARTVLHQDGAFVETSLEAIERVGREGAADLDHFLGLLRDDPVPHRPSPGLADLRALVAAHPQAGVLVELELDGDVAAVPAVASREAYRIVQEGLTNASRHARGAEVGVRVSVAAGTLAVDVHNSAVPRPRPGRTGARPGGGQGLAGLRERVQLLGGSAEAGPTPEGWRLSVRLPIGERR